MTASKHLLPALWAILSLVRIASASTATYDTQGRLTRVSYPDGRDIEYTYDAKGNLTNRIISRPYQLTITVDPPEGGTVTGNLRVLRNTQTALTATPGSAFDFVAFTRPDGTVLSTNPTYNHTVTGAATIIAKFSRIPAPAITQHPTGGQVQPAAPITLSVAATGRGPLTYRWNHNGEPLANPSATLSIPTASFLHAGTYTAEVSNPGGTTISQSARISIALDSYTTWKNTVFTPAELSANDPATVGLMARIGSDGLTNLLHYALGSRNKNQAHADSFTTTPDGSFQYNRLIGSGGLTYKVSISPDLQTWDDTETNLEPTVTPAANADGLTERITLRLKAALRTTQRRTFFRLFVATTPPVELFSDDFDGPTLDAAKWTPDGSSVTLSDGTARVAAGGWNSTFSSGNKFIINRPRVVIEWKMSRNNYWDVSLSLVDSLNPASVILCMESSWWSDTIVAGLRLSRAGDFGTNDVSTAGVSFLTPMEYRVTIDGTAIRLEQGPSLSNITASVTDTLGTSIAGRSLFLRLGAGGSNNTGIIDWVRVYQPNP
jgi:YD repeat-containing protein